MQIDPKTLRRMRERAGMSQIELAHKAKVSPRTINRIETSQTEYRCRPDRAKALAAALGVKPDHLVRSNRAPELEEELMRMRGMWKLSGYVSSRFRFHADMIEQTYGVSQQELLELAPLLFVLVAERSLSERRRAAAEAEQLLASMGAPAGHPQLVFLGMTGMFHDALSEEMASINKKDIFAEKVSDIVTEHGELGVGQNPFVETIMRLVADSDPSVVRRAGFSGEEATWWPLGIEIALFMEKLHEITNRDLLATEALIGPEGTRVNEIPMDLLTPDRREDRIQWLADQLPSERRAELAPLVKLYEAVDRELYHATGDAS